MKKIILSGALLIPALISASEAEPFDQPTEIVMDVPRPKSLTQRSTESEEEWRHRKFLNDTDPRNIPIYVAASQSNYVRTFLADRAAPETQRPVQQPAKNFFIPRSQAFSGEWRMAGPWFHHGLSAFDDCDFYESHRYFMETAAVMRTNNRTSLLAPENIHETETLQKLFDQGK